MRRWMTAGCFESIVSDLRILLWRLAERDHAPTAAILDSRTLQSTPESGAGGLRRRQTPQGVQRSRCRRYTGQRARAGGRPGGRAGPRACR